jgi:hypothetical protein
LGRNGRLPGSRRLTAAGTLARVLVEGIDDVYCEGNLLALDELTAPPS